MPPGAVPYPFGACRICQDKATGVHYGVATCEGCKGFFKRSTTRGERYKCYFGGQCDLTPQTRNRCKSCRYKRCLDYGMSVEAVKMGRIPKVEKEKALKAANTKHFSLLDETASDTSLVNHCSQKTFLPSNDIEPAPLNSLPTSKSLLASSMVQPNLHPCSWGYWTDQNGSEKEIPNYRDTVERNVELGYTDQNGRGKEMPNYRETVERNVELGYTDQNGRGKEMPNYRDTVERNVELGYKDHNGSEKEMSGNKNTAERISTLGYTDQNGRGKEIPNFRDTVERISALGYTDQNGHGKEMPNYRDTFERIAELGYTDHNGSEKEMSDYKDTVERISALGYTDQNGRGKEIPNFRDTAERISALGCTVSNTSDLTEKVFEENGSSDAAASGSRPQYSTSVIQVLIEKLMETPPLDQWMEQNFEAQIPSISQSLFDGNFSNCNSKANSVSQFERKKMIEKENCRQSMDVLNHNNAKQGNGPWLPCNNNGVKRKQFPSNEILNTTSASNSPCNGKLPTKFFKSETGDLSNCSAYNNFQEYKNSLLQRETTQSNPADIFKNTLPPNCTNKSENSSSSIYMLCKDEDEELSHSELETCSPLVTFDGGRASPESARLIETTTKRLHKPTELLFSPVMVKREKIKKHLSKENILPATNEACNSEEELFSLSLINLEGMNKQFSGFSNAVPGFKNLCAEDKTQLIKRAFLDIWMLTSSEFFVNEQSFLLLNGERIFSRTSIERFLPCESVKAMFKIAEKFNSFELTDLEKTILCIIQLTSTENVSLKDVDAVQQLNSHYLNILANQVQLNHGSKSGRILIDIFRQIPSLEKLSVDLFSSLLPNTVNSTHLISSMLNKDGGPPHALQV